MTSTRCAAIHEPNGYCPVRVRCELEHGHVGSHRAVAASNAIVNWGVMTFAVNFEPAAPIDPVVILKMEIDRLIGEQVHALNSIQMASLREQIFAAIDRFVQGKS